MEHNSSHSSHDDDDDSLRVPPSQVDKIISEFDKLETWLAWENHNIDSDASIKALKKLVNNDDNNISILCDIYLSLLILMLSLWHNMVKS